MRVENFCNKQKRFISREALMKKHANIYFIFVLCFVVLNRVFCALLYSTFLQYHKTLSRSLDKDCDILQFFPKVIQTLWIVYGQINRSYDHIAKYIETCKNLPINFSSKI